MEPQQLQFDFQGGAEPRAEQVQGMLELVRRINGNPQMEAAILRALKAIGWEAPKAHAPTAPVLWIPPRMPGIPAGLIVAPLAPGLVTKQQWLEALGRRVAQLVMAERDPVAAVKWASRAVNPDYQTDDPNEAAEVLVIDNTALRQRFDLAMRNTFPAKFNGGRNPIALEAAEDASTVEAWAELAAAEVSGREWN